MYPIRPSNMIRHLDKVHPKMRAYFFFNQTLSLFAIMLQSAATNSSTVYINMHPTSRIFFSFGFAKFGVRWAAKYSSSGTGWTRGRSAVCMDVYETGHYVLHGCLNACLAFIFALAQNFWHNSIYQRPHCIGQWKGAAGPPFSLHWQVAGNSNEYCLSILK